MANKLASYLALLLWMSSAGFADFKAGLTAFDRQDYAAAFKEWEPIAERGDPNAQFNLGLLYASGKGVPQDYPKAAEWYRKAAEQGVAAAEYNLGLMYANGQGVPRNREEASKWFMKAAEQGVGDAESGLANVYETEGSFQNYTEAEKWYRKAAERGVASAAFDLAAMYDLGQGVPRNYEEALKWYTKAAEEGYAPAMTNLGILYYNAQGVKRDLHQAYAWFARAQKAGDPRAAELFKTTAERMKPKEIKQAQALVDQWRPSGKAVKPAAPEEATLFRKPETTPATGTADRQPAATAGPVTVPVSNAAPPAAAPATAPPAAKAVAPGASSAPPHIAPPPAASPSASSIPSVWTGVGRIVALGDIHGDYEQFVAALDSAGLIDGQANWTGGKAHLVQTGDVVDRGPNSRAIMNLLMKLEKQAAAAGGAVHALIGNHEAMDVYGDLRFVSPAEFSAFRSDASEANRQFSYQELRKAMTAEAKPEAEGAQRESQHSPGELEHRAAFSPTGEYGRWIRSHNAIIKIDRTLFVHAGLGIKYADWTIDQINDRIRQELNDFNLLHGGITVDEEGPLWYTGLAKGDEAQLALVDRLLKHFDVDRIVIGHTYSGGAIQPRFGGKVILIDIGLSRIYDNIGKLGCLDIDQGQVYALHRGRRLDMPRDENGPEMLRYLKQAAALDPAPSPLAGQIQKLEAH